MSSYDCVLPIDERELRRIVAAHTTSALQPWPVPAAMLRHARTDAQYEIFDAIRAAAAIVEPVSDDRYYGWLRDRPHVAVAGTKNGFRLEGLERTWVPEQHLYRCTWRSHVEGAELLDALLHGCRGLPGLPVLPESPAWPSFDDEMLLGYLLPHETRELDGCAGALGGDPHARMLRAMIARAAAVGLCLVTLQAGLSPAA